MDSGKEKLEDKIIQLFTIPEVKRHIDNETGLVTKEESDFRIITLFFAFTLLTTLIASFLCIEVFKNTQKFDNVLLVHKQG